MSAKEGLAKACCTNLKTSTYGRQTLEKLWKTKWAKLQTKLVVVVAILIAAAAAVVVVVNISQLLLDGKYVSDIKVMGDSYNKYFCSVGENLQAKFNPYDNNAFTTYLSSPAKNSMFCTPVTLSLIHI